MIIQSMVKFLRLSITIPLLSSIVFSSSSLPTVRQLDPSVPDLANNNRSAPPGKPSAYFEANQGQADQRVRFIYRGNGSRLDLSEAEATWSIQSTAGRSQKGSPDYLRMQFTVANPSLKLLGEGVLPGKINYFTGNNPTAWHSDIPTYSAVRYQDIYPGIDLLFYTNQNLLEFDFTVNPGSDPTAIRLAFPEASGLSIDAGGNLLVRRSSSTLQLRIPTVYQAGDGLRKAITGAFEITAENQVGFAIGSYDRSKPLVIDPIIEYSSYLGGRLTDNASSIAVDQDGYVYVSGSTTSDNFPTTPGSFMPSVTCAPYCLYYAFLSKFSPDGSTLIYSTYIGPISQGSGANVAVDNSGNAYLTGTTSFSDYPITQHAFQRKCDPGPYDNCTDNAFVTKFSFTGSELIYSTYLGGAYNYESMTTGNTYGNDIAIDQAGNAYVAGETFSMHFPTTPNAFQTTGYADAFVTKLNPDGSGLIFSTYLGGGWSPGESGRDGAYSIAIDASQNVYVAGYTCSSLFPVVHPFQAKYSSPWATDGFVSKFNSAGSELIYSTYLGGGNIDSIFGIAVDGDGNAYVTGQTKSLDFPLLNPLQVATDWTDTTGEAFVTKLNPQGNGLVYSTYLGGISFDYGMAIAADSAGNAYITGNTESWDFPCVSGYRKCELSAIGVFATKINRTGSAFIYSIAISGWQADQGNAITINGHGKVYLSGVTWWVGVFPTTPDAFQPATAGDLDAFLVIFQEFSIEQRLFFLPVISGSR